jgi:hypothetical protein
MHCSCSVQRFLYWSWEQSQFQPESSSTSENWQSLFKTNWRAKADPVQASLELLLLLLLLLLLMMTMMLCRAMPENPKFTCDWLKMCQCPQLQGQGSPRTSKSTPATTSCRVAQWTRILRPRVLDRLVRTSGSPL